MPAETILLSEQSRAIVRLFYVTQRLEPAIKLIEQNSMRSKKSDEQCAESVALFFEDTQLLKTEIIKKMVLSIGQYHSLQPLLTIWKQIQSFRYGINPREEILILDFAKVCLVTYQSLLLTARHIDVPLIPKITPLEITTLEQVDQVFEKMEEYTLSYFLEKPISSSQSKEAALQELPVCFAFRFYINKRLEKTFMQLHERIHDTIAILENQNTFLGSDKNDVHFDNQIIQSYCELLQKNKTCLSLEPLFTHVRSFDFVHNTLFIKEFLILLCIIYQSINVSSDNQINTSASELHEHTIEELLAIIDTHTHKLSIPTQSFSWNPYVQDAYNWLQHSLHFIAPSLKEPNLTMPIAHPYKTMQKTTVELIRREYGVTPDEFTNLVFQRYYFIKRLDTIILALLELGKDSSRLAEHTNNTSFSKSDLPLKPLSTIWDNFIAYKNIADLLIVKELTREIFILSNSFLNQHLSAHYTHILQDFLTKELPETLAIADKETAASNISTNNIILRFYHLKRLEPSLTCLHHLDTHKVSPFLDTYQTEELCAQSTLYTTHLLDMISAIQKQKSLKPLFSFWNGLAHYKHMHNETTLREFAQLTTLFLQTTIQHLDKQQANHPKQSSTIFLQDLTTMPLEDILDLLDILVEQLPGFIENTELNSTMKWKEWLKKYWLMGPISTLIFAIRIYILYKNLAPHESHPQGALES